MKETMVGTKYNRPIVVMGTSLVAKSNEGLLGSCSAAAGLLL